MATAYGPEVGPGTAFRTACEIRYTDYNETGVLVQRRRYVQVTKGSSAVWATLTVSWNPKSYALSESGIYADTGWVDVGWKKYGEKVEYIAAAQYTSGSTVYYSDISGLYYTVPMPNYRIKYSAEGGTGAPDEQIKEYGTALKLRTKTPDRTGYIFVAWEATDGARYQPGATYTKNEATTMKAVWQAKTLTITFDKNDGSGETKRQILTYGKTGNKFSATFEREAYELYAWAVSKDPDTQKYAVSASVPDAWILSQYPSITLYAVWKLKANTYIKVNGKYVLAMAYIKENGKYKMSEPYVKSTKYKKAEI